MKNINFSAVRDLDEHSLLPPDRYPVEIERAEEETSRHGTNSIKTLLRVTEGEYAGAVIFDRLYETEKALPRVKHLLKALGIPTDESLEVTPELLVGRKCLVDVYVDSFTRNDGSEAQSNAIPYVGYHALDEEEQGVQPY